MVIIYLLDKKSRHLFEIKFQKQKDSIGLHRVENVSHTKPSVSLHIYIPPYSECRGFDQHTGKNRVCQITFYSKYGETVTSDN